jgi:hypothetical protein
MPPTLTRVAPAAIALLLVVGAGGGDGSQVAKAERAPARAGDVWALDSADDRRTAPAALLAYVSGLHVMVLDGDDAYAGMTHLEGTREPDGARRFRLANDLDARLVPADDRLELRFSTGEVMTMRKQDDRPAADR